VTRIDRLARSTFDLFAIVKQIVDAGGQFPEPWADTATSTGRLMIAVLGRLADVERDLIRTIRRRAGTVPRRAASTWAVPPNSLRRRRWKPVAAGRAEGATLKELAKSYDVGLATISKLGA